MGVRVAQGTRKPPELFGTLAKAVPALQLDSLLSQAVKLGACRSQCNQECPGIAQENSAAALDFPLPALGARAER